MKLKSNIGSRAQAKPETLENQRFPVAGEEGFEDEKMAPPRLHYFTILPLSTNLRNRFPIQPHYFHYV